MPELTTRNIRKINNLFSFDHWANIPDSYSGEPDNILKNDNSYLEMTKTLTNAGYIGAMIFKAKQAHAFYIPYFEAYNTDNYDAELRGYLKTYNYPNSNYSHTTIVLQNSSGLAGIIPSHYSLIGLLGNQFFLGIYATNAGTFTVKITKIKIWEIL